MSAIPDKDASHKCGRKLESYNKRKAVDLRKTSGQRQLYRKYPGDENMLAEASSSESEDTQQKRQKIDCAKLHCDLPGCSKTFQNELDFDNHRKSHGDLRRHLFIGREKTGGSSSSVSSISTAAETSHGSDCSNPGLTCSHPSSRSSSSPPDLMDAQRSAQIDSLPSMIHIFQSPIMYDLTHCKSSEIWPDPINYHLEVRSSTAHCIAGEFETSRSMAQNNHNFRNGRFLEIYDEPEETDFDQEEITAVATPNARLSPSPPSFAGTENPSSGGPESSRSCPSSDVSDNSRSDKNGDADFPPLKRLINEVLRLDSEVAEILFQSLNGKLERLPSSAEEHGVDSGILLFSLLELQDTKPMENYDAFTTYAPSSSSGSSSSSSSQGTFSNGGAVNNSSSNEQNASHGDKSTRHEPNQTPENNSPGQTTKQQKSYSNSSSSTASAISLFRCIHNAFAPEIFCVTHETKKKYSTCAGPGWNSIQHLKEHIKSHHSKETSALQCNHCQQKFKNQKQLKDHEKNVDCLIKCPICRQEFESKASRLAHQEQDHVEEDEGSQLLEIDEILDEKMKENLKMYGESLKKGKGPIDSNLEEWIVANTKRYMNGRPLKANAKLELGQWYTIFKTIANSDVPKHPFYDFGMLPTELAQEKILLIHEKLIDARIQAYGEPPSSGQQQRKWYQDVLRDSLKLAAKTQLVLPNNLEPSLSQNTTPMSITYSQDSNITAGLEPETDFTLPNIIARDERNAHQTMGSSFLAQGISIGRPISRMSLPPVFPETRMMQHAATTLPAFSTTGSGSITNSSTLLPDPVWNMQGGIEEPFHSDFGFDVPQDYNRFGPSGSNTLPSRNYPDEWHMPEGDRR